MPLSWLRPSITARKRHSRFLITVSHHYEMFVEPSDCLLYDTVPSVLKSIFLF